MNTNPKTLAVAITGVIAAMVCGFFLGSSSSERQSSITQSELQAKYLAMKDSIPLRLQAGSASGGKTISLATGSVTPEVESLFILDHLTGTLQCWLLNPRDGAVGGIYTADVNAALKLEKGEPDFVMTTGEFFFRASGKLKPANSVCYVGEGKSGKVAGFGLAYEKGGFQNGEVQTGELTVICSGPVRQGNAIRE